MNRDAYQIDRRRLADQIIDKLVSMIADGVLKTGNKLPPEPELMKQFGVGRSYIRYAVGALALIGLIKVHPGHGAVTPTKPPDGPGSGPFPDQIHPFRSPPGARSRSYRRNDRSCDRRRQ